MILKWASNVDIGEDEIYLLMNRENENNNFKEKIKRNFKDEVESAR